MNSLTRTLFVAAAIVLLVPGAFAAICKVTKVTDGNDGLCSSTDCSLREAAASPNCDTILFFQVGMPVTITLTGGEIRIDHPVSILGRGADRMTIDANNVSRIFYVTSTAYISGLTLLGGNGTGLNSGSGGAIATGPGGSLILDFVHVKDSTVSGAGSKGGGLYLGAGNHVIRSTTFSTNWAGGLGGGLAFEGGQLKIVNSTFNANTGSEGGAMSLAGGATVVRNITVKANTGLGNIYVDGSATLDFGNSIIDTILRASTASTAVSSGYNLISVSRNDLGSPVSYQPSDIFNPNAPLNTLQRVGGPTPTMRPPAGHPAIDAGSDQLVADLPAIWDQQGWPRRVDGNDDGVNRVDIGAVEYSIFGIPPSGSRVSGRVLGIDGRPARNVLLQVVYLDGDTLPRTMVTNQFGYYISHDAAGRYISITATGKNVQTQTRIVFNYPYQENIDFGP